MDVGVGLGVVVIVEVGFVIVGCEYVGDVGVC